MAYWLFQGNPKYYRLLDGIQDFEQMYWLVTLYANQMVPSDGVVIWLAGKQAGIYATAEIIESPQILKNLPDADYWIDNSRAIGKLHCKIQFTCKLLDSPLLKIKLLEDNVLKRLPVIRYPNRTNFKLTLEEWERVHELCRLTNYLSS